MKRSIGSLTLLGFAGFALAQTPFTIVRPADGSKVRETVRVKFPMESVPSNGYVGIFVGGKFVEAVVPMKGAEYLFYDIDTKARQIPDGPLTVEAVLYADFNEKPRIIDRSSVQVTVSNSANIPIPDKGLKLTYKFRTGQQWIYNTEQRTAVSTISESHSQRGGRAAEMPLGDVQSIRMLYSVDNTYSNGDALIRMQPLTPKGKNSTVLVTEQKPEAATYYDYQMHPLYMRVSNTGMEIFGSIPTYFPMLGTTGEGFRTDLFALRPLPTMPSKALKPGEPFPSRFLMGDLDLDKKDEVKKLTEPLTARGEFVGVEWEMGHPCARLKYSLAVGDRATTGQPANKIKSNARSIEETVWFALDLGVPIRMEREEVIDRRINSSMGGPTAGGPSGAPGAGVGGRPGATGGPSDGEDKGFGLTNGGTNTIKQGRPSSGGGRPGTGGGGPTMGGTDNGGGGPTMGGGVGRGGGGSSNQGQLVRIIFKRSMRLEK